MAGVARLVPQARREDERVGPGEHHVRVLIEEVAREAHGVAQQRDLGHRPRAPVGAHEARVEPRDAVGLEIRAGAGVQERLVLEGPHRGLDRVEGRAPAGEHLPPGVRRALARRVPRVFLTGRRRAAASVHDDRWLHGRSR